MTQFEEERQEQRHKFRAGLAWKLILLLAAAGMAILILLAARWIMQHRQQPHCPNPKTFLESTVPSNCR